MGQTSFVIPKNNFAPGFFFGILLNPEITFTTVKEIETFLNLYHHVSHVCILYINSLMRICFHCGCRPKLFSSVQKIRFWAFLNCKDRNINLDQCQSFFPFGSVFTAHYTSFFVFPSENSNCVWMSRCDACGGSVLHVLLLYTHTES